MFNRFLSGFLGQSTPRDGHAMTQDRKYEAKIHLG